MSAGDLAWTEIRNGVRVVSYCINELSTDHKQNTDEHGHGT